MSSIFRHPSRVPYFPKTGYVPTLARIAFDSNSNSGQQTAQTSYSWNHTCSGSNRFLAVDIEIFTTSTTVSSVTYNGVSLTLIGSRSSVSGIYRVECWGLVAPSLGTNTIAVTLSGVSTSSGTATSYNGVNQTLATEGFNSNIGVNVGATDATVSITPVADLCWIRGAVVSDDTTITANQTSRNNVSGGAGSGANEDTGPITPAGATTMSYTDVGALASWVIAGYAIRPVSASSGSIIYTAYYYYSFIGG